MAANRILRNWTYSPKVDKLSAKAEVFFTRLIMTADNFGRYFASPKLLKAALFPLKEKMKSEEMVPLLNECAEAGLLQLYYVNGKDYLSIYDFGQRLYITTKSTFPAPPLPETQTVTAYDNNPPRVPAPPRVPPLELELELELNKSKSEGTTSVVPPAKKLTLDERKAEFYQKLIPYVADYGKEMVRAFYSYWTEANENGKKMRWEMERTFEIKRRFVTWSGNQIKFDSKTQFKPQGQNGEQETRVRASQATHQNT